MGICSSKFQAMSGLNMTGKVDWATMMQLHSPRCGVADMEDGRLRPEAALRRRKRFAVRMFTFYIFTGSKYPPHIRKVPDISLYPVLENMFRPFKCPLNGGPLKAAQPKYSKNGPYQENVAEA